MSDTKPPSAVYNAAHSEIVLLLDAARRAAVRSVNAIMTQAIGKLAGVLWHRSKAARTAQDTGMFLADIYTRTISTPCLTTRHGAGFLV